MRALGGGHLLIGNFANPQWAPRRMEGAPFRAIKPLLESQDYIASVQWTDTEPARSVDFSNFRHDHILGESLLHWQARHIGIEVSSEPWLFGIRPDPRTAGRIIVARSPRYQNWQFQWPRLVKEHRDRMLFVGLPKEHAEFQKLVGPVEYFPTADMLAVARAIAGSDLVICNQTSTCWVALGLGHPMIQEQSPQTRDSMLPRDNVQYCLYDAMPTIPQSTAISIAEKPKPCKPSVKTVTW